MPSSTIRGFSHLSRAWYGKTTIDFTQRRDDHFRDEVTFGLYSFTSEGYEDGCKAEAQVKWYILDGKLRGKLEAWDDAWAMLGNMPDLITALAARDEFPPDPKQFCDMLIGLGFRDLTKET